MPDNDEILSSIKTYLIDEVLEGEDVGLDSSTQLLQLGVLNSMEIVRLVGFIKEKFGVEIPGSDVVADNFKDLTAIATLVTNSMAREA